MQFDNSPSTFVYFISSGSTPIKIGISGNPNVRLGELQTAHYQKLHLLFVIECAERSHALELESAFHRWYENQQLLNEWFSISPKKILADIQLLTTLARVIVHTHQIATDREIENMDVRATEKMHSMYTTTKVEKTKDGLFEIICPVCQKRFSAQIESDVKRTLSSHMRKHISEIMNYKVQP